MKIGWGIYSEEKVEAINGWFLFTTKFTAEDGTIVYRWFKTKHRDQDYKFCLWQDKNRLGRKLETKYFTDRKLCELYGRLQCV